MEGVCDRVLVFEQMVVDVTNSLVGCASRGISHVWSLRQTLGEAFNGNEKNQQ